MDNIGIPFIREDPGNKEILEEIKKNNTQINKEIIDSFTQENPDDELFLIKHFDSIKRDIQSIFYFFDNFHNDENWNKILSPKYKDLSKENIKQYLKELKDKQIYDYVYENKSQKSFYIKLFNCLYKKKEAFDFLIQRHDNIDLLYDKLGPNVSLTVKDIDDTINCIDFFKVITQFEKNEDILYFIKKIKQNEILIGNFQHFSDIYPDIIKLSQSLDNVSHPKIFYIIKEIVKDTEIIFLPNKEEITIKETNKKKSNNLIKSLKDLFELSNKINIEPKIYESIYKNEKYKLLYFFKENINNIQIIYQHLSIMREKHIIFPISIKILIKEETIKYYLIDRNNKVIEKKIDEIETLLLNVKKDFIEQLETFYKNDDYMRFFHGNQIINIIEHLDGNHEIFPLLRYILNDTDKENIEEGDKKNVHSTTDYINYYSLFNKEIFENISNYVKSFLKKNKTSLEEHYINMRIKKEYTLKGIFVHKSESESMEEDILQLFLDNINRPPIPQNILITNKETSYEEVQAFLNRAILCRYNTLFAIVINESFSLDQQKDLNRLISKLLSYKNEYFNKREKKSIPKENTYEYMDSCLVFVCNEKSVSSLNYIGKIILAYELRLNEMHSTYDLFHNIHVIKSEICGLGKTEIIKKKILDRRKEYIHFPIDGNITKDILYNKLKVILDKIEKIKKERKINVAIHLDLYDNNKTSILNEFLFSFLITKFYSNNESIIYIPKDIEIFVEVPNCIEDFISKHSILYNFEMEYIRIDRIPNLYLSRERRIFFKNILNIEDNNKILEFISSNIGIEQYSYYQLNIFIELLMGQYKKYNKTGGSNFVFYEGEKDITQYVIENVGKCARYFTSGAFANLLVNKDIINKINGKIEYIKLLGQIYENDLKDYESDDKFRFPLIFLKYDKKHKKGEYRKLYILRNYIGLREIKEPIEKNSEYFLSILKEIFDLAPSIERLKEIINKDNYYITNDIFRKMVLIIYRIISNIPVILMGETGSGKTALIKKLNELLNNGKSNLEIINIHQGINDDYLIEKMKVINIKVKNINEDIWVFFDELNTCDSFAILTEIFSNRSFGGEDLSDNIKIIGACNPYRIRKKEKKKCGLGLQDDIFDNLVYLVKLMPQSLMNYIFNFGSLSEEDESKFLKEIISKHFTIDEEKLKEETKNVIISCHQFLRKKFDPTVVSLRKIIRFSKCYNFFIDYFKKKNKYNNLKRKNKLEKIEDRNKNKGKIEKILSIIISIYICYYMRLIERETREEFDKSLLNQFINLVNWESDKKPQKKGKLVEKIYNEEFNHYIKESLTEINQFSDILEFEQEFLLDKIELEKGIGHNRVLRENVFLLFVSLGTNIPLIIEGNPGCGKRLSTHLILKSMKGKYSKNIFFRFYPSIIQTYILGSQSTTHEDVQNAFTIAEEKLKFFKKNMDINAPISMLLFDELGLAEKSKYNPLKDLHIKLFNDDICFVGITNWSLDTSKLNRAFLLSIPESDEDLLDLIETSTTIAKSFNDNLAESVKKNNKNIKSNNTKIFEELLPSVYYYYKKVLKDLKELKTQKKYYQLNKEKKREPLKKFMDNEDFNKLLLKEKTINIEFHGNIDYFNLIKGVARELNESNKIEDSKSVVSIIEKYIERNFGGMEINIDIDKNDIELNNNYIMNLENDKTITSVKLFKSIYNSFIDDGDNNMTYKNYKIDKVDNYNIIKCIYDNTRDENSRYLLLGINPSLVSLIHQNIAKKLDINKKVYFIEGSPFVEDEGMEYQYNVLNEIMDHAKNENGHLLILHNLDSIYPFLYDLFKMNYIINDGKNYARIYQWNLNDQLALINKRFRIVLIADKKSIDKMKSPFLSRFEKINIKIKQLLIGSQKKLVNDLMKYECNFKRMINKTKNLLLYNIRDLLIGCKKEDIQALVYDFSKDNESLENIKLNVIKKLVKLLPQDIIINLHDKEKIKKEYFKNKKFYNILNYLKYQ